ncbi:Undecaprenyl-phosphate galactose phosphotransferase, WbaP/exopolysaccharide biosynthesis polyprenyl glycosylphosphotransferase [Pseudarthrobacter equi]|uniref:Undecaprenyl-phosphate galactose phosphotransferase, WbaP/exopolysaccharide biosynthesis polyprenyl glycosylphosphotransferase n=1 Tax=Pseudarthrobacter equi TaxID=728066 RepID=A0A1H2B495_9MICC|nr:sugar transferase [Pseudarthrobacter equi]SDT52887.1 Undecaprenyl-phosphate galactose phosphotransferase, WbaP/exopolysaccharide biosynthesis polyprenyl glycosylphosphotransferase [Pseudarthrobacter equi]
MNTTAKGWRPKYARRLLLIDAAVTLWAVVGAYIVRFGYTDAPVVDASDITYQTFAIGLAVIWWLMLGFWGSRNSRVLGAGSEEYKRVLAASVWLFGIVAVVSYALRIDTARGFVGLAFPAGVLGLLVARWLVRQHLSLDRKLGRSNSRVLIIGGPDSAKHLVRSLTSAPAAGYHPVAAHLPGAQQLDFAHEDFPVPVTGVSSDIEALLSAIEAHQVDAVAVSAGALLTPSDLRTLGWELAAREIGMILAPALTDVAGPRIHTQPVAGLPLIHVSTPKLTGGKKVAKRSFDLFGAGILLILLSPLFLLLAALVKTTSAGPVFYAQERIGLRGTTFKMLKFRSMKVDADAQLQQLLAAQGSGDKPLFKIENDPRITPVGQILRKYSLDELPQLLNVFLGSMSLVGPRPQRASEVALYDDAAHRRLYVSPGMSGLWQVSGRSNLTWEESIRLDLYYVENWSLMGDVVILFKTFRAVFGSTGAF